MKTAINTDLTSLMCTDMYPVQGSMHIYGDMKHKSKQNDMWLAPTHKPDTINVHRHVSGSRLNAHLWRHETQKQTKRHVAGTNTQT